METIGKSLILLGAVIVLVGVALTFFEKIPYLGKLPGDIHFKKDNFEFYFPLATSILISVILSGIFWLINYFGKK
jgi:amino acid transporter